MEPCVKKRFVPLKRKTGMNCKDRNLSKIVQGCSREDQLYYGILGDILVSNSDKM
jgi:hypothetical protein